MDDNFGIQKHRNPLEAFFSDQPTKTDPFGGSRIAGRVYDRVERIAAALYLLTSHVSPNEPLRNSVRSGVLQLLDTAIAARSEARAVGSERMDVLRSNIRSLISQTRMLAVAGLVSMQNADILISSLDELGAYTNSARRSPLADEITFSSEDLETSMPIIGQAPRSRGFVQKDIKDGHNVKDTSVVKDVSNMSDRVGSSSATTPRQEHIIQILRNGGSLGIRDISSLVPQYSEKMVQRELAVLVSRGQVHKEGLKRWSRYSLSG